MTPTLFDPEDPKLTAYALGELRDPAERAEVEFLLQQSPEARQTMKEIKDITEGLTAEYDQERLAATAESADTKTANVIDLPDRPEARRVGYLRPLLAAAAVLLVAGWLAFAWRKGTLAREAPSRPQVAGRVDGAKPQGWGQAEGPSAAAPTASEGRKTLDQFENMDRQTKAKPTIRLDVADAKGAVNSATTAGTGTLTLAPEPLSGKNPNSEPSGTDRYLSGPTDAVSPLLPGQSTAAADPAKELRDVQLGLNNQVKAGNAAPAKALLKGAGDVAEGNAHNIAGFGSAQPAKGEYQRYTGHPATTSASPIFGASGQGSASGGGGPTSATVNRSDSPAYAFDRPGRQYDVNGGISGRMAASSETRTRTLETDKDVVVAQRAAAPTGSFNLPPGAAPQPAAAPASPPVAAKPAIPAGNRTGTFGAREERESAAIRDTDAAAFARPNVEPPNTAVYEHRADNPFLPVKANPLSTFSIDVDTASYANVRRFIDSGTLPPPDAVRLEELINYFPYNDAPPTAESGQPFAIHLEAAACPWAPEHRLVRIGLKGREISTEGRPASNLVFLLDVSGSMSPPEWLPLIREAMKLLTRQLNGNDHVAIVTYAGNSGLVLPSTPGDRQDAILGALDRLESGGSTNGASGIALAYQVARKHLIKGGTNRVILATDGDFNVGITNQNDLVRLIQDEAKTGVFLSVLGVGTDNYKDATMQKLADKGNGNYHYLDRLDEARKVLVEQMSGTLLTIAKDVKIQVEFNPAAVGSYRLLGYEKRMLRKEDFNDDRVDAGEIGAGHSVTALYEVVPAGQPLPGETPGVDALKYGPEGARPVKEERVAEGMPGGREMLTVKLRHKAPDADRSERTYEEPLIDQGKAGDYAQASPDFKFAAAVAAFGLALRESPYREGATFGAAVELAQEGKGADLQGYRAGFIELARRAQTLRDARQDGRR